MIDAKSGWPVFGQRDVNSSDMCSITNGDEVGVGNASSNDESGIADRIGRGEVRD